jgi:cytochrome c oxidase assembly factor CtaG
MSLPPFHWHLGELAFVVVALLGHHHVVREAHRRRLARAGLLSLALVVVWPVGDVAASVSITVATVQRLVIMVLAAPLLLLATPIDVFARLTRPALVDALVRRLTHPGVAIAVVTIAGTATLATPVVDWGATSTFGRDVIVVATLALGLVLWAPALPVVPGTRHLSAVARAGYVFASALVVTSLSFVWIFARHPLYPALHHQYATLHVSALLDQQIAGFVAKLGAYLPMWAVAFTIFARAESQGTPAEESTLHWADVERQLERVDRQRERARRRHRGEGDPR